MAGELVTYLFLAEAVLIHCEGIIWARNSPELTNVTGFERGFSPNLEGFRFERDMNIEEDDNPESLTLTFQERPPPPAQLPSMKMSVTTANGNPLSSLSINSHLVVIYVDLIKRMSVGIILKQRTVLTTCTSTLVSLQGQFFAIKPEFMVILSEVKGQAEARVQPVDLVYEIRRHPFCGIPFGQDTPGPWMNDAAVLILYVALAKTLPPIELASADFSAIFSDIHSKISSGTVCQAIGIEFMKRNMTFLGTSVDVKIADKSKCKRLCSYMIPQCEPQIGGYFVQYVNSTDKARIEGWMGEAALVCDGKLYAVVNIFEFTCDASLIGLAPKPEAILHMHLSTAKLVEPTPSATPRKGNAAPSPISSCTAAWVSLITTLAFPMVINTR